MATLNQLADPASYRRCGDEDLVADEATRRYWSKLFRNGIDKVRRYGSEVFPDFGDTNWERLRTAYVALFDRIETKPESVPSLDLFEMSRLCWAKLAEHGLEDPYLLAKQRETDACLNALPRHLTQMESLPNPHEHDIALASGLLTGNIFDLGTQATVELYEREESLAANDGFLAAVRQRAAERPWFEDGVDAWAARLGRPGAYQHAVIFVDNAGADFVLGVLPFTRRLLAQEVHVTLAANTFPALNDMTAAECVDVVERAVSCCDVLSRGWREGSLTVRGTGNRAALIDLANLDAALVDATADADLVVLVGMGRAIQSNWDAVFGVDSLRVALIKDPEVARKRGAEMFANVFRFERAHDA